MIFQRCQKALLWSKGLIEHVKGCVLIRIKRSRDDYITGKLAKSVDPDKMQQIKTYSYLRLDLFTLSSVGVCFTIFQLISSIAAGVPSSWHHLISFSRPS